MLYETMMEPVCLVERVISTDGLGGYTSVWTDGKEFKAAIGKNNTSQTIVAEKTDKAEEYTITTYRTDLLSFHDVVKRLSDGKIFRVTSDSIDNTSPAVASFSLAQATAESWVLTDD